jgi:pectate lyase
MRYKSLPLSTRSSVSSAETGGPPLTSRSPRPWWFDWLLTIPILLLIPVMLLPYLVKGSVPAPSVDGPAVAGQELGIGGTDFPSGKRLRLVWDGAAPSWLPAPKVKGDGSFSIVVTLPRGTAPGAHVLTATLVRGNDRSAKAREGTLVSMTVDVAPAAATATPTPTASPSPRATPTVAPSTTPPPSVSPTASPSAPAPAASASPEPSSPPPSPPVADGPVVGYGSGTVGGAGGRQLAVTTLSDSGAGSLRAALEASGPRIVTFRVAGTIRLQSSIRIEDPFVTVAGETAPEPGIVVRDGAILVRASEVILRHLRLRPGDQLGDPADADALTVNGMNGSVANVVVDHVTMLWGPDIGGLAVLGDVRNLTVQNSIMGEGLYLSAHPEATVGEGGHSMAANVTQLDPGTPWPRRLTFWHDLFTTSDTRMPRFQGAECVDVVNNVIYNWGRLAAYGNPRSLNLVGNWYRSGPQTEGQLFWELQTSAVTPSAFDAAVYLSGNVADGIGGGREDASGVYASSPRCGGLSVAPGDPRDAYAAVLSGAGAIAPIRDAVDGRVIANVLNRTGRFFNGAGYASPNPYWP